MPNIYQKLEAGFEKTAYLFARHRYKTVAICLTVTAILAVFTPQLRFDTSTEGFFHPGDPAIENYNRFREQFGRDDVVMFAVAPAEAMGLFSTVTLTKLKRLHQDLESGLPYVDDLTSLLNVRHVRGEADQLIVGDLVEQIPDTPAEMERLRDQALANPFYRDLLLTADGRLTTIIVKLDTYDGVLPEGDAVLEGFESESPSEEGEEAGGNLPPYLSDDQVTEFIVRLEEIVAAHQSPDFRISVAGTPVVDNALKRLVIRDTGLFATFSLLLIAILLFLMFRRLTGVLLPLAIVVMSLVSMLGIMALAGVPLTIVTQILSSFILVVGVGDAVHILAIFYQNLDRDDRGNADRDGTRQTAMARALSHSGLAVAMTSLTTAGGLISFAWADIAPVADLGIFAACGVLLAFLYTVALLPALAAIIPINPRRPSANRKAGMNRLLARLADLSTRYPKSVTALFAMLTLIAMAGLPRLHFSHNILEWLPEDMAARRATVMMDQRLKGSVTLEAVVDTDEANGLYRHKFLAGLDAAAAEIEKLRSGEVFAGKTWSLTTVLKEIHQALNENRPAFYAIPDDDRLIAQEFLLFENSGADDLEDVMDLNAQKARLTVKAPFKDAIQYSAFIDRVQAIIAKHILEPIAGSNLAITGVMALFTKTMDNVITSMQKSYLIAFGIISVLMFVFIRQPSLAALSLIPNLVPLILVLGLMGWTGIDLDSSNMLIGSIALGLIVDDTLHFMHNFGRYFDADPHVPRAVHRTLTTTGRALLVTSSVLFCGFWVYGISALKNIFNFGMLTASAIFFALAADFFLVPAVLALRFRSVQPLRKAPAIT